MRRVVSIARAGGLWPCWALERVEYFEHHPPDGQFCPPQEINIMKFVGATNAFIRMPFLVGA